MIWKIRTALLEAGRLFTWLACAAPAFAVASQPIEHVFPLEQDKSFSNAEAALSRLAARKGSASLNHFCVIGQALDDGGRQAWVYWREGRAIVLWEPTDSGAVDLANSRRYLVFKGDIVPSTDKRLPTSSYLVSTDWADALIVQCERSGTSFSIKRRNSSKG